MLVYIINSTMKINIFNGVARGYVLRKNIKTLSFGRI